MDSPAGDPGSNLTILDLALKAIVKVCRDEDRAIRLSC